MKITLKLNHVQTLNICRYHWTIFWKWKMLPVFQSLQFPNCFMTLTTTSLTFSKINSRPSQFLVYHWILNMCHNQISKDQEREFHILEKNCSKRIYQLYTCIIRAFKRKTPRKMKYSQKWCKYYFLIADSG